MDTSGLPVPDAIHPLLEQLHEALLLEVKYQPNLYQLPTTTQVRDGGPTVFDIESLLAMKIAVKFRANVQSDFISEICLSVITL